MLMLATYVYLIVVTQARVICLICTPEARGLQFEAQVPAALRLQVYISGRSLVPVLQLLCNTFMIKV